MTLWNLYWWGVALAFVPFIYFVLPQMESWRRGMIEATIRASDAFVQDLSKRTGISQERVMTPEFQERRIRFANWLITAATPVCALILALAWPLFAVKMAKNNL